MPPTPPLVAQALLDELGIDGIPDVRAVAHALGVEIEEADVDAFDGALVRIKGATEGVIAVRRSIREAGKKNFTIAHELGHLLLPGHDTSTVCAQTDVETWESGVPDQEIQANEFAGSLLMPASALLNMMAKREPSIAVIESIATACSASLTAAAYRFIDVTSYACAMVWNENGIARWCRRSAEFTHWIRLREQLDSRTFAADCFRGKKVPESLEHVPASAWLDGGFTDEAQILEQTRCMASYNGALSLLWLREPLSSDSSDDDPLTELEPREFSLRRKTWPKK